MEATAATRTKDLPADLPPDLQPDEDEKGLFLLILSEYTFDEADVREKFDNLERDLNAHQAFLNRIFVSLITGGAVNSGETRDQLVEMKKSLNNAEFRIWHPNLGAFLLPGPPEDILAPKSLLDVLPLGAKLIVPQGMEIGPTRYKKSDRFTAFLVLRQEKLRDAFKETGERIIGYKDKVMKDIETIYRMLEKIDECLDLIQKEKLKRVLDEEDHLP